MFPLGGLGIRGEGFQSPLSLLGEAGACGAGVGVDVAGICGAGVGEAGLCGAGVGVGVGSGSWVGLSAPGPLPSESYGPSGTDGLP